MLGGWKAYICLPLSAATKKEILHNMDMARFYMEKMAELYHCRCFASHAYLPPVSYTHLTMPTNSLV